MKNRDSSSPAETVVNIEELLKEILLRVTAGTLILFKRVSKQWLSLSYPVLASATPTLSEPNKIELVASIHLPKLPGLSNEFVVVSYCMCALVGDRKVCFTFLYSKEPAAANIMHVVVLTLEFACSKSGASNPPESSSRSSSSHPSFLSYTTFCGSFSAKALGYYVFQYDYTAKPPSIPNCDFGFGGCVVL
ncbi:hypothetical protein ACLB2K_071013 [Fragaria x ananassa]